MHELSFGTWLIHISSVIEWIFAIFVINKISTYKKYNLFFWLSLAMVPNLIGAMCAITWELSDFQGKWLVIYFYPKDFTAGCTLEAKGFSELKKDFSKYNAEIVGISADTQDSHESFCSEKSINYTLLSDPDGIISNKYGSWIPPFSDRNTFLISPDGEISYRWISVLPINHAKEVLNVLKKKI